MFSMISRIIELIMFILTWRKGRDEENKVKREALAKEAKEAILSGDRRRINRAWARIKF